MPIDPNYERTRPRPAIDSRQAAQSRELAANLVFWAGSHGLSVPEMLGLLDMAKAHVVNITNAAAQEM